MTIKVCYFSPTGTTLAVATYLAEALSKRLSSSIEYAPYTLPHQRESLPQFGDDELLLWATPVYAGRIPNKTLDYVRSAILNPVHHEKHIPAIALVTFGNRAYDNALAELSGLLQEGGMQMLGAAAMVTRHSFSDTLGAGRPNEEDLSQLDCFASQVVERMKGQWRGSLQVPGEAHPEKYYTPLKTNNAPAGFLKAKPSCNVERCSHCAKCVDLCPMGSIVWENGLPQFKGICIKCQACRRGCPTGAIAFTDPDYRSHVAMIEQSYATPKKSEFFVAE